MYRWATPASLEGASLPEAQPSLLNKQDRPYRCLDLDERRFITVAARYHKQWMDHVKENYCGTASIMCLFLQKSDEDLEFDIKEAFQLYYVSETFSSQARLLCMEATTDGLAKFQLPVTSVQSMLCFAHGVKSGFNVAVYMASLVPISGSKDSKDPPERTFGNLFQCTNSAKVCVIKKTAPPRAYKKRVQSKKDESEEQGDEFTDAEEEARFPGATLQQPISLSNSLCKEPLVAACKRRLEGNGSLRASGKSCLSVAFTECEPRKQP
ncbi:unnamed protein product [Durusdinium trenchii]|uniref:Uncharacterized protein n=1 Tax=Durusdinium trenchii TaxID=1381693 RepID=A0ABP0PL04_9DINO